MNTKPFINREKSISIFHFIEEDDVCETKRLYIIYENSANECMVNILRIDRGRAALLFNYLLKQIGVRKILLRFPISVDHFMKKKRDPYDTFLKRSIEGLKFACEESNEIEWIDVEVN
jgi:hypothetical protein